MKRPAVELHDVQGKLQHGARPVCRDFFRCPRLSVDVDEHHERSFDSIYERYALEVLRYAIGCMGRREIAEEIASEAFPPAAPRMAPDRSGDSGSVAHERRKAPGCGLLATPARRTAAEPTMRGGGERVMEQPGGGELLLHNKFLKPEHRMCLAFRYARGMTRSEVAARTGADR